ncbi:MAG: NAD-dependent isocitrate dehydrogenase [Deltaproteobacteria bacterium]|nr:NAD-dependent isocitrate dehydrogenase [Deltaproteobacteria bacterium]
MTKPIHIAVIGGDGIGPEVVEAELAVLEATGLPWDFKHYRAGDDCLAETGQALPPETLAGALAAKAVVFGAAGVTAADVILKLRAELGTFVNLRPSVAMAGVECLHPQTDLVIVRENTECLYTGIEAAIAPGVVTATRVITRAASERIARYALAYARENGRSKVTAVHKANVLRKSDGLFLDSCRRAAKDFPDVNYEEALVDSVAMRLVMRPEEFEVVVTTNLFGDILSDLAAGLIGGLGMCPSANLGPERALFEPVHGTAPDIAGQGKANPGAAIMCGAMLLRHLGYTEIAQNVEQALAKAVAEKQSTPDLGGRLTTKGMTQAVIDRML